MASELQELREMVVGLHAQLQTLQAEHRQLQSDHRSLQAAHSALQASHEKLQVENQRLRQQNAFLCRQLFGKKSERLDPNQLELLMDIDESASVIERDEEGSDEDPPAQPRRRARRRERKVRIPEGTPREEQVIDPDEVTANPDDYECIGEELSEELDVVANPYVLRITRRRKFKSKSDRARPPIIAPLPAQLIERSIAGAGLLSDIMLKRFVEHQPLYRQEQMFKQRYGIEISRKTLCDWVGVVAGWLKPIYHHIGQGLRKSGYLQIDETPIRYLGEEGGGSRKGYLWVYHRPGGDVLYQWHRSRSASCLEEMLNEFTGTVQCDGHSAYTSYAKHREQLDLAGCWAHVRRYFFEAIDEDPKLVQWILHQIGLLYGIERQLRENNTPAKLRASVRCAQSSMILTRLEKVMRLKLTTHLPQTGIGKAIGYALGQWDRLIRFRDHGEVEIDNNLVENAVRPTALGKKNWLFFGSPDSGERSAIIYTILESCKRRGINQGEYLRDVLSRLPSMKITEVAELTPENWFAARTSQAA